MANDAELEVTGGRLRQMVHRAKGDQPQRSRSHAEEAYPYQAKESAYDREKRAQRGLRGMSREESTEWVRRFMENDDILSELEAMDHVRNVSPLRRINSGSSSVLSAPKRTMSYVPASPLPSSKYGEGKRSPLLQDANVITHGTPQGVALAPPPAGGAQAHHQQAQAGGGQQGGVHQQHQHQQQQQQPQQYQQQHQSPYHTPQQQQLQQDPQGGNAELALQKAAQIMEELQEMASLTGLQHPQQGQVQQQQHHPHHQHTRQGQTLPLPPQGVALPPPSTTLLPSPSPPVPLSAPLPPKPQDSARAHHRLQEPSATRPSDANGRDTPREYAPPDTPAEDKWLTASQSLRGRSTSRDHPERGRASPVEGVAAGGPGGGRSVSASRVPSPSPSDRVAPQAERWPRRPDSAADFMLERHRSLGPRDDDLLRSRPGPGRDAARQSVNTIRSESPRLRAASDLDGRLGAPQLRGPGSRAASPLSRQNSYTSAGGQSARAELSQRLQQQRLDLQSAVDNEFRAHEHHIKSVVAGVDSARSTPAPPLQDTQRRSPVRARADSAGGRLHRLQPHDTTQPLQPVRDMSAVAPPSPRLDRSIDRPAEAHFARTSPILSPTSAKHTEVPDDWLSKPLQDPFGKEVHVRHQDPSPAQQPTGRVSPARWGGRDPVGVPVSPAERELSVASRSPRMQPTTSPLQKPHRSPAVRAESPFRPRSATPVEDRMSPRREYPDEFPLSIVIDGEHGSHTVVRVKPSDSIAEVKAKVQEARPNLPLESQRLLYQGREAEDSLKVCDYGITYQSQLQLLIKSTPDVAYADEPEAASTASPTASGTQQQQQQQAANIVDTKSVWVTTKGKSSVVKMDISPNDSEGELLHRAKRKLGVSTEVEMKPFINGREVRLAHAEVKEGWVYTLEPVEGGSLYPPQQQQQQQASRPGSPQQQPQLRYDRFDRSDTRGSHNEAPSGRTSSIPPPPETPQRRLRKLYDSLQRNGRVTRGDVHHGLRSTPNIASILAVDATPSDLEVQRTIAAFNPDSATGIEWSELLREVLAYQNRCELSGRCWNETKPWQLVAVGSAVEPSNSIAKNRQILQMGLGRVLELNLTEETPDHPRIPVARVYFRQGEDQQRVWVRLTDLRVITGGLADHAPVAPQPGTLDFSRLTSGRNTPVPQGVQSINTTPRLNPLPSMPSRLTARGASPSPARSTRPASVAGASSAGRGGAMRGRVPESGGTLAMRNLADRSRSGGRPGGPPTAASNAVQQAVQMMVKRQQLGTTQGSQAPSLRRPSGGNLLASGGESVALRSNASVRRRPEGR